MERQSDGARFLAPTYDHGSALGAGLTDENRRGKDAVAFARRGRANPFSPRKQILVDLALGAVRRGDGDVWVTRVAALDEESIRETLKAPPVSDLLFALGWRWGTDEYSRPPAHSPTLTVLDELAGEARTGWRRDAGVDLAVAATARAVIRRT